MATLEAVQALRAHAKDLQQEATHILSALNAHESRAVQAHWAAPQPAGAPSSRPVPPWERELRLLLIRMGAGWFTPGFVELKFAEDAVMRGDGRRAAGHLKGARDDVRTFAGYLDRVRRIAQEHGLVE